MKPVAVASRAGARDAAGSAQGESGGGARGFKWWLPVIPAGAYAAALAAELPALVAHSWWSADSASAGFVAQLYSHPPAGQYIVLGSHGWYEAISFYLLTRGLPGHLLLWYGVPVAAWVATIALVGLSARSAFGRHGAGLAVAGLLCLAPVGLMLIFQPTAHTNVLFHAAALAAVCAWILPRIRTLALAVVLATAVLIGAFTGLAITGDAIGLVWAVLPFAAAVGVCAWCGPVAAAARTLAFALVTLITILLVTVVFTAIMHGAGLRVDELAQSHIMRFVKPGDLVGHIGTTFEELAYLVGGNFLGHRIDRSGLLALLSGTTLLLGGIAVVVAVCRQVATARRHRAGGGVTAITTRLVHIAFWSTCLTAGLLTFLLSSAGAVDYRYLLGPLVAIAALLPVVAARSRDWRIAVGAGLAVMALVGLVRLATRPLPYLPEDAPLAQRDIRAVTRFANRYHATYGYGAYWDAITITWHTHFRVRLHAVIECGPFDARYCPLYHGDSFTAAYIPRKGRRTLFIADSRFGSAPAAGWGRPLAREHIGRLTLYAYRYDIASHFPKPSPGQLRRVITGQPTRLSDGRKLPSAVTSSRR